VMIIPVIGAKKTVYPLTKDKYPGALSMAMMAMRRRISFR
jgi:hypothetical protein